MSQIVFSYFLGFVFSVILGHFMVFHLNRYLRFHINLEEKGPAPLTPLLGLIERFIYTGLFSLGDEYYTYIAIFFGLKVAQRLVVFSRIENAEQLADMGKRLNVYLICNIISLIIGILGGGIIIYLQSSTQ